MIEMLLDKSRQPRFVRKDRVYRRRNDLGPWDDIPPYIQEDLVCLDRSDLTPLYLEELSPVSASSSSSDSEESMDTSSSPQKRRAPSPDGGEDDGDNAYLSKRTTKNDQASTPSTRMAPSWSSQNQSSTVEQSSSVVPAGDLVANQLAYAATCPSTTTVANQLAYAATCPSTTTVANQQAPSVERPSTMTVANQLAYAATCPSTFR